MICRCVDQASGCAQNSPLGVAIKGSRLASWTSISGYFAGWWIGVDERTLADTPVLDPARTVRTDVQRVLWAEEIPPHIQVSGHIYDVETGLVTTIVDAKASRQPA